MIVQEDSLRMGFAYIVAVISLFDEYANDLLYLTEGSCFPRYCLELSYQILWWANNSDFDSLEPFWQPGLSTVEEWSLQVEWRERGHSIAMMREKAHAPLS